MYLSLAMFPVCLSNTPLKSLSVALTVLGHFSVTSLPNAYSPASLSLLMSVLVNLIGL